MTFSSGGDGLGKHGTNKLFAVWLSKESYEAMQAFLDKFSAGSTFPEQARKFLDWLGKQTEGIDQTKLALKLQQIEDEQKKAEFQHA